MVSLMVLMLANQMDKSTGVVMASLRDKTMETRIMLAEELLCKHQNHAVFARFYLDSFVQ